MKMKVRTTKWSLCVSPLMTCMAPEASTEAKRKAWEIIKHMAEVLDYHLDQEVSGAEVGESAAVPSGMVEVFRLAAEVEFNRLVCLEVAAVE